MTIDELIEELQRIRKCVTLVTDAEIKLEDFDNICEGEVSGVSVTEQGHLCICGWISNYKFPCNVEECVAYKRAVKLDEVLRFCNDESEFDISESNPFYYRGYQDGAREILDTVKLIIQGENNG